MLRPSAWRRCAGRCGNTAVENYVQLQQRGIKHSRHAVIENKAHNVRRREALRFRKEVEHEGSEPRWKDIQEKLRKSPGRKTLGRGEFGLGRKATKKGFEELELLHVKDAEDLSDRVHTQHRALLKSGIPPPVPLTGKNKSNRTLRAESILHDLLQEKIMCREFHDLDELVRAATGVPYALIEITRVELSEDFLNCSIFWRLPSVPFVLTELVFHALANEMELHKGRFRSLFNSRIKRRRAPFITIKHDDFAAKGEIVNALLATQSAVENERGMNTFDDGPMTEEEVEALLLEAETNPQLKSLVSRYRGNK